MLTKIHSKLSGVLSRFTKARTHSKLIRSICLIENDTETEVSKRLLFGAFFNDCKISLANLLSDLVLDSKICRFAV